VDVRLGHRVELNLAGRRTRGLVIATGVESDLDASRLRPIGRLLGDVPWIDASGIGLLEWAAQRFGAPLGDVVRHALPGRVIDEERRASAAGTWPPDPDRARPALLEREVDAASDWSVYGGPGELLVSSAADGAGSFAWRPLPGEDVGARLVELATRCISEGRDVLLIVPDPRSGVADTVVGALRGRLSDPHDAVVDLRGGPSSRLFYRGWLGARSGRARVVVGERSAAFFPLERLGLAVVLDEASPVHKEQRSPRHHVREVVLERARRAGAVGLATADVPSAVLRSLIVAGRVAEVVGLDDVTAQRRPRVHLEGGELEARARISRAGMRLLRRAVEAGGYGVVLAARRGEGRALVCTRCRDLVRCPTCSAAVARSPRGGRWCPACGAVSERPPRCERCGPGDLAPLAAGAERLGEELARTFEVPVVVLEGHAPDVPLAPAVLVMTRGSALDRPPEGGRVLGAVLPDMDGALRRPTLDAAEDSLRLAFRIAGWTVSAGVGPEREPVEPSEFATSARSDAEPQVVVETRETGHHALQALVAWDAEGFWRTEEEQRRPLRLPPNSSVIRVDVPSGFPDALAQVRTHTAPGDDVIGPLPLGQERRALLIRCQDRRATLAALRPLRETASRKGSDLRVDVDPVDLG
jgi:primosomal protein N' (replication factor Y)